MSDDLLAAVVAMRRLGTGGGRRQTFSVERTEARLRLRDRPGDPWQFTLVLVRAVLAVVEFAEVDATTTSHDGKQTLELRFALDPAAMLGLELGTVFDESLAPDPGPGDASLAARQLRMTRLVARAVNESLATRPHSVDLLASVGGRTFTRRETTTGDPYAERPTSVGLPQPGILVLRITYDRRVGGLVSGLVSGWFDGLLGGGGLFAPVAELWRKRVPGATLRSGGASLTVRADPRWVELGDAGRLWGCKPEHARHLVRDGVVICSLDAALREQGLDVSRIDAAIEAPAVALVVDETNIVRDTALANLVAWLHDATAHAEGSILAARWPAPSTTLQTASGQTIAPDDLPAWRTTHEHVRAVPYVWRHEAEQLPLGTRPKVIVLWPSELAHVVRALPDVPFVAARSLGARSTVAKSDLTALAGGSLPPKSLVVPPWTGAGAPLPVAVEAYIHRHGIANSGAVMLLAEDRTLARAGDPTAVIAGVTLVARVELGADRIELSRDATALRALARWVTDHAEQRRDELIAHAFATGGGQAARRAPFVERMLEQLDARQLELRYVAADGASRLQWRADARLALVVATTRDDQPITLGDALARVRDVGGLVLGEAGRRWYVLEVEDGRHDTWVPTPQGREVLERVLGRDVLWDLPTVAQAHPHAIAASEQPHLVLDREEVGRLLLRVSSDGHARAALLGHLLVARALGRDELGLADVPLLAVFDPRAVTPGRLVSLAAVQADGRTYAIVPPGTATRELPGPVIEAGSGLASLLHEVSRLPLEVVPDLSRRHAMPETTTVRASAPRAEPALRWPIAHPLAVGALVLVPGAGRSHVDLWGRGLHVGELELPPPFTELGGRLWLSDTGIKSARPAIEAMLLEHARALVVGARAQARLAPVSSTRRRVLERFVEHVHAVATAGDDRFGLRALLGTSGRAARRVLSADAATATRLPALRRLWLAVLIRHGLGRQVEVDRGWLTWRLAHLADPAAVRWELELGGRHRWIKRAVDDDSAPVDIQLAALAATADALSQASASEAAVSAAMLRILATAHVTSRT
jgi:hypothetical protein